MTSETPPEATQPFQQRALSLFRFLRDLTELRSVPVRNVDEYDRDGRVVWLANVPDEPECRQSIWDGPDDDDVPDGAGHEPRGPDTWLEVDRLTRDPNPAPSAALESWIDRDALADSTRTAPALFERITVPTENGGLEELTLDEHDTIRTQYHRFLADRWQPWAAEDQRRAAVQSVYDALFAMQQKQQRLGERFEVVLAFGLLCWKTPPGYSARRHLIVAEASVEFDDRTGRLAVGPGGDGARPALEQDMLDPSERPAPDSVTELERATEAIGDGIGDRALVLDVLQRWVHRVGPSGQLDDKIEPRKRCDADPRVTWAPALVLRERTDKSLIRTFREILDQIGAGQPVPDGVARYLDVVAEHRRPEPDDEAPDVALPDIEYLPLESNEEQRRILERLQVQQGVLVQGPPGTGKSHTIANLCCHLLATGQRVLITSHTARALKVLEAKLPQGIADLCVSLLGASRDALQSLDQTVQAITERQQQFDEAPSETRIAELTQAWHTASADEARAAAELRDAQHDESREHDLAFGYRGTLQGIAVQLNDERAKLGWIVDRVAEDAEPPLAGVDLERFVALCAQIASWPEEDRHAAMPARSELPDHDAFRAWLDHSRELQDRIDRTADLLASDTGRALTRAPFELRADLAGGMIELCDRYDALRRHVHDWAGQAAREVLADQDRAWRERLNATRKQLAALGDRVTSYDDARITGADGRDPRALLDAARAMLEHRRAGGGLGFWLFRPAIVKSTLPVLRDVRVDGRPPTDVAALTKLVDWLEIGEHDRALTQLWSGVATAPPPTLALRVAKYGDLCEPLQEAVELHERVDVLRGVLGRIDGVTVPAWHLPDELDRLRDVARAARLAGEADAHEAERAAWRTALTRDQGAEHPHSAIAPALAALDAGDEAAWARAHDALERVWLERDEIAARDAMITRFEAVAPRLAEALTTHGDDAEWQPKLARFDAAWSFARAVTWLENRQDPERELSLRRELEHLRDDLRRAVSDLAEARAWHHCLTGLTEHERQHLVAWTKAVRRIGKGTGKHAGKHRRAAREHMEQCRSTIPAWIMPIYRVAESVQAGTDAFDVVIIDEASQSGPEALFLLYLTKKIVVVGDDKQISPDYVGITREDVDHLRQRHISELPHADAFSLENSLFDLADIRYGGRIRLREHFRCMPEIIGFSNRLCYRTEPLIPLKQFGAGRLTPVVRVHHVPDGYRQGSGQRVVNPREAEVLVEQIAQCCDDGDYDGKSMGVVSLQGAHQARLIEGMLLERLGPEVVVARDLVCGDAYAFQGDERDVMFLSMVAAPSDEHRIGTLADQRSERRFNVAVSRAKEQLWLFHTATAEDLSPRCLRRELLEYCLDPQLGSETQGVDVATLSAASARANRDRETAPAPFDSWFEVDVALRLAGRGYDVRPQFEVAGYRINLVVEGGERRLAIECDGDAWHGPERFDEDLARQRQLERCGWTFWRVRGSRFYLDPDAALTGLWDKLSELAIEPRA